MNFSELNKEQKQMMFLAVIGVVAVLYVLFQFVLTPVVSRLKDSQNALHELEAKVDKADISVSSAPKLRTDLTESAEILRESNAKYIPTVDNALSWAIEQVYDHAKPFGIEIAAVSPITFGAAPWARSDTDARMFNPYTVKVVTRCGYFTLIKFLEAIEKGNPYVCVSHINIKISDNLVRHDVEFMLAWPSWAEKDGSSKIRGIDGEQVIKAEEDEF